MSALAKRERAASSAVDSFPHSVGDVVLVRWSDERIYYAKIKTINKNRQTCQVMFEDNRRGTAEFGQIHAGQRADLRGSLVCSQEGNFSGFWEKMHSHFREMHEL